MKDPWFPITLIFVTLLAVWVGILGPLPPDVAEWINKWQNLIAAIIATGAAIVAYRSATEQLRQNEQQERNRRSRKHSSVRAMLPLALSQVIQYAQASAFALNDLIPLCQGETLPRNIPINNLPQPLPHDTLKVLAEFIEYSDAIDASLVEAMVAWIQIHDARVRGLIRDHQDPSGTAIVLRARIEGSIIDAASIYASAAALFDYGRRRDDRPPATIVWENVRSALTNMRMWDHQHPRLYQIVEGREGTSQGPFDRLAP